MDNLNLELITTIGLAFIGYLITYVYDKISHKREEGLKLVNQRLEKFYGPLYFSTIAGRTSYETLLKKIGRERFNEKPTEEELIEWRKWVVSIFMPNNQSQRDIIYNNAYLTIENKTPECLITFVKHVSEFEVIMKKWETSDYSEHFPMVDYPKDMAEYIRQSYLQLKNEQKRLIGKSLL